MYNYIDKLLSYKVEETKKDRKNKNNIEKINPKDYLKSCLIFIYDKSLDNNVSFLNELGKYSKEKLDIGNVNDPIKGEKYNKDNEQDSFNKNLINISSNNILNKSFDRSKLDNVVVISSDICGLGKSHKIRKMLKEYEKYYYFPLGGNLTKKIIYNKLLSLINKIKRNEKKKVVPTNENIKKDKITQNDNFDFKDIVIHCYPFRYKRI